MFTEQRQRTDVKVSQAVLDQIIIDIQSPPKLKKFLCKLIPDQVVNINVLGQKKDTKEGSAELLRGWRNGQFTENPNALLSLALERSGCSHVDKTFFPGKI